MDADRVRRAWQKFTEKMRALRGRQLLILKRFEGKAKKRGEDRARKELGDI